MCNIIWETHLKRASHRNPTVERLSEIIAPVVYELGLGAVGGFVARAVSRHGVHFPAFANAT
jgi:tRNA A37 threonylcarbamoyladenosine dehydratase